MNPISILALIVGLAIASISRELNPGYGFVSGYWPALLGLAMASGPWTYFHALRHSELIKKNVWPSHWKANALRFALCTIYILPVNAYNWNWVRVIDLYVFGMCFFGVVFNFSLNHFRGEHPLYVGKTDGKDAITDIIFSKLGKFGGITLLIIEVAGIVATGYIYCLN